MLRRTSLSVLALLLLTVRPGATWSIVCVNTKTREVGVASATCLAGFNLRTGVPVICVGEGAAAAQSFLDQTGNNRRRIFEAFRLTEKTPEEILADLDAHDNNHHTRQYGIVNFTGAPATFTGSGAGLAATGVTGSVGDFLYAVQGNVLTGDAVVFAAEQAFREDKGDMGQKLMAAMEAARALGGDGRCSCSQMNPTGCGVPPPGFTKSAHCGFVIVARVGDTDGAACNSDGCAQGSYYLLINYRGRVADPDPVIVLGRAYELWRGRHLGRPDAIHSRLSPMKFLPTDGTTIRDITLELRDVNDERITHGGATIEVESVDGSPITQVGEVKDLQDGRYLIPFRAGDEAGVDRYRVRVTDVAPGDPSSVLTATLYPYLEIPSVPVSLYSSDEVLLAVHGGSVSFVVNQSDAPHAPFLLVVRLGADGRLRPGALGAAAVLRVAQRPFFPAGPLVLDEHGRAETTLEVPAGAFAALIGGRVGVTGYVLDVGPILATNTVVFSVRP